MKFSRFSHLIMLPPPQPLHTCVHFEKLVNNYNTLSLLCIHIHIPCPFPYILLTVANSQIELNPKLFDLNPRLSLPLTLEPTTPNPPLAISMLSIYRSQRSRNETNPTTKHTMTPSIPLMSTPQIPMRQQRPQCPHQQH